MRERPDRVEGVPLVGAFWAGKGNDSKPCHTEYTK
jgi:hypothetical protein